MVAVIATLAPLDVTTPPAAVIVAVVVMLALPDAARFPAAVMVAVAATDAEALVAPLTVMVSVAATEASPENAPAVLTGWMIWGLDTTTGRGCGTGHRTVAMGYSSQEKLTLQIWPVPTAMRPIPSPVVFGMIRPGVLPPKVNTMPLPAPAPSVN